VFFEKYAKGWAIFLWVSKVFDFGSGHFYFPLHLRCISKNELSFNLETIKYSHVLENGFDVFSMANQGILNSRILSSSSSSDTTTTTTTDCTSSNTSETGEALFANLLRVHNPGFLIVAVIITVAIVTIVVGFFKRKYLHTFLLLLTGKYFSAST